MKCEYRLRSDDIYVEDYGYCQVFGVEGIDAFGKICVSVKDVFVRKEVALANIRLFNTHKLDSVHLMDVIEDILS